jgi:hypothetical protein
MTRSAWIMLIATWSVVIFFTAKFFLSVVRTPPKDDE